MLLTGSNCPLGSVAHKRPLLVVKKFSHASIRYGCFEREAGIKMLLQIGDAAGTDCLIPALRISQDASFIIIRPATITTAASMLIGVAGSPRKYRPATNEPTAPFPVQMV